MSAISITSFSGLAPRVGERLLPDSGAVEANNVVLTSGEIRPIRAPTLAAGAEGTPPYLAAYRAEWNGNENWRLWSTDVDIAVAPLDQSVEQRYYWTGDGEPRFAKYSDFGVTDMALGIPVPVTKPSVSATGGVGSNVTRIYCVTFLSQYNEESGPSPSSDAYTNKVDATWTITGFDNVPANSGTGTAVYASFKTTFTNAASAPHWLRVGDEVVLNGVTLSVVEVVSTSAFKVTGDYSLATSWTRKASWNTTGMKQRLYRSAGTTASYQLVAERTVSTGSWTDTLTDAQIMGDELISDGWKPPSTSMRGLLALPNGAMCGFDGNQLKFSEPFQPHAWKDEYSYGTDYEVVGISSFGTAVVAATAGNPYIADGVEPASVTLQKVSSIWPCLSKRSVVSIGNGVVFATSQGIAYVGVDGADLWSKQYYTSIEWEKLNPYSMVSSVSDGRLYVMYTPEGSETDMLVFYPGEAAALVSMTVTATELYTDPRNGKLYIITDDGAFAWDSSPGEFYNFVWRSKEFNPPNPVNYGAAKVDFTSVITYEDAVSSEAAREADLLANQTIINSTLLHDYGWFAFGDVPIGGDNLKDPREILVDTVTFTLFVDDMEKFSKVLTDSKAFRLPSGYKSDRISFQVSGNVAVRAIKVAETMLGLKQI